MSEKTVVFHPLERLDLIDVDAIQAQVFDYLSQALGNILGRDQVSVNLIGAMLAKPTSVTINNGVSGLYRINFSDFTFIDMNPDSPVARSRKSKVITYDASESFHDVCDFSSLRSIVQNYYNVSNSLPPVPTQDLTYQESLYGQYYPFIWARAESVEVTQDTRRFWSVANAQEITTTVATRTDTAVRFAVQYTQPTGDWVKIARIHQWSLNGSTVELNAAGIIFITLADALVPLPPYLGTQDEAVTYYDQFNNTNDASDFSGLVSCFRAIQNELALIRSGGSSDSAYGSTHTNMTLRPRLSLDGLFDRTLNLQTQIREVRRIGSAVYTLEADRGAGAYNFYVVNMPSLSQLEAVSLGGAPDFTLLLNKDNPPTTPLDFAGSQFNPTNAAFLRNWHAALSMFTVQVDPSFVNHAIRVNAIAVNAVFDDFNNNNTLDHTVYGTNHEKFVSITPVMITDQPSGSAGFNDILRVQQLSRRTETGVQEDFYGVRIGLAGIDEVLTSTNVQIWTVRINIKVDVEIVEV